MENLNEQTTEKMNRNRLGESMKDKQNVEDWLYENILYQMEMEKVYLLPDLSLIKFSQIVGTTISFRV